ncbi:MAG: N-acetylmuramoyl-L-alanine amidase [Bacteroidales bacterium]|nr:N-acetylmuramoyl-L-alanine amidase [Bacteroidales bacterium]
MNKKYPCLNFQWFFIFFCAFLFLSVTVYSQNGDNEYKLKTVVIDAGHGGKDPGSVGKRTTEKEIALAIALKLGNYIEQHLEGVKVIYTRKTDVFVELHKRAEIANANKADLFISIHVNGNVNTQASGTETLLIGLHRAGENFEVAKKENSVILLEEDYSTKYEGFDPNSPESYQIFSLMQERYFERSLNFGALVQDQFRERAMRKDRGLYRQGLLVLARTAMPGVLIEAGFVTNPDEEKFLMSEEGQDLIASAIFRAFRDYKEVTESRSSFLATHTENDVKETDTLIEKSLPVKDTAPVITEVKPAALKTALVEFKVQIAASSKPVSQGAREFKGLTGVKEYRMGNIYKYAIGSSATFQDIIPYSKQIKEKFPDAFIIAVKENKIIPLDQALKESTGTR